MTQSGASIDRNGDYHDFIGKLDRKKLDQSTIFHAYLIKRCHHDDKINYACASIRRRSARYLTTFAVIDYLTWPIPFFSDERTIKHYLKDEIFWELEEDCRNISNFLTATFGSDVETFGQSLENLQTFIKSTLDALCNDQLTSKYVIQFYVLQNLPRLPAKYVEDNNYTLFLTRKIRDARIKITDMQKCIQDFQEYF